MIPPHVSASRWGGTRTWSQGLSKNRGSTATQVPSDKVKPTGKPDLQAKGLNALLLLERLTWFLKLPDLQQECMDFWSGKVPADCLLHPHP